MTKRRGVDEYFLRSSEEMERLATTVLVSLREDIGSALGALATRTRQLREQQDLITQIVRRREQPILKVSDHALIRWLERFGKLDADSVRQQIAETAIAATGGATPSTRKRGDAESYTAEGVTFVVTGDRMIVTLYPDDGLGPKKKPEVAG